MTPAGSNFRNLDAWRAARRLMKRVYAFTDRFPSHEQYCLTQQMRKASHSVHSNIAEGHGRLSKGEWIQFLGHSRGSLMELESDVIAAFDLGYCTKEQAGEIVGDIKRTVQIGEWSAEIVVGKTLPNQEVPPRASGERRTASGERRAASG